MSLTITVPASVPSLFHISPPLVPSLAEKKSTPSMPAKSVAEEELGPGKMSLTRTVPASLPSLFHSSSSPPLSLARKNSVPLTLRRKVANEESIPGLISLTSWGTWASSPLTARHTHTTTTADPQRYFFKS